jgi:hypothetical protein
MTNRSPDRGPKNPRTAVVSEDGCGVQNCAKGALPDRYLAINWQRTAIKQRVTCRERRFPTPPQPRNNGDIDGLVPVTCFRGVYEGTPPVCYRFRKQILPFLRRENNKGPRGAGGQRRAIAESAVSISSHGIFCLMDPLPCSAASEKRRPVRMPTRMRRQTRFAIAYGNQSGSRLGNEPTAITTSSSRRIWQSWRRGHVNVRFTSTDRRFPIARPGRNTRDAEAKPQ